MKRFVEIIDGMLYDAPSVIVRDNCMILSPTEEDYMSDERYYEKIENKPEYKKGYVIVEDGFDVEGKTVVMKYRYEEEPVSYRTFSKYKIVSILMQTNYWTQVKQWLEEVGYLDLFMVAQELYEGDQNFISGKDAFMQKFGKTEEEIEEFLSQCVID